MPKHSLLFVSALLLFAVVGHVGCPLPMDDNGDDDMQQDDEGKLGVLFTADDNAAGKELLSAILAPELKGAGPVDIDDIESLTVSVDRIILRQMDDDEPDENVVEVENREFDPTTITVEEGEKVTWLWEEDGEHTVTNRAIPAAGIAEGELFDLMGEFEDDMVMATFNTPGLFPYFSDVPEDIAANMTGTVEVVAAGSKVAKGAIIGDGNRVIIEPGMGVVDGVRVDLVSLLNLSLLIARADVPAGLYNRIELEISDPVLVLAEDSAKGINDVQLTANGRLFINTTFEVLEDEDQLLILDFGGINLIEKGTGGFNLTPQLRASVTQAPADVIFPGEIAEIDGSTLMVDIGLDSENIEVDASVADITLSDAMMGSVGDLMAGDLVEIEGTINTDGVVVADTILVIAP